MKTRKTFIHEEGTYEAVSRLPELRECHAVEGVSLNNSYDWYPEKQPSKKKETDKFESIIDLPLGEEYKLNPKIDNYENNNHYDAATLAAINEEINNLVVK